MPPSTALAPPERPDPAPRGTTATPCLAAHRTADLHLLGVLGTHHRHGRAGARVLRPVEPVLRHGGRVGRDDSVGQGTPRARRRHPSAHRGTAGGGRAACDDLGSSAMRAARRARIVGDIDLRRGRCLEIGPLANPVVDPEVADVRYVDVVDRDGLLAPLRRQPGGRSRGDPRAALLADPARRHRVDARRGGRGRRALPARRGQPRHRARARHGRLAARRRAGAHVGRRAGAGGPRPPLLLRRAPHPRDGGAGAPGAPRRRPDAVGASGRSTTS